MPQILYSPSDLLFDDHLNAVLFNMTPPWNEPVHDHNLKSSTKASFAGIQSDPAILSTIHPNEEAARLASSPISRCTSVLSSHEYFQNYIPAEAYIILTKPLLMRCTLVVPEPWH